MSMRTGWFIGAVAIMAGVTVGSAQQGKPAPKSETWVGKISASQCGANAHSMGTPEECTAACVKNGGEYVFVGPKDKVFKIGNQKFTELPKFAGKAVDLTGTANGDTITITKIAAPKK